MSSYQNTPDQGIPYQTEETYEEIEIDNLCTTPSANLKPERSTPTSSKPTQSTCKVWAIRIGIMVATSIVTTTATLLVGIHFGLLSTTDGAITALEKQLETVLGSLNQTNRQQNKSFIELEERFDLLNHNQRETADKLNAELKNMPGRAIFTGCVRSTKTYSGRKKILFDDIRTKSGISNDVITEFTKTGIFRVAKGGIYHISVYITISTYGDVRFDVMKNDAAIGFGHTAIQQYHQTSTVIFIENLKTNDKLHVQLYGSTKLQGDKRSCISLLQLTG